MTRAQYILVGTTGWVISGAVGAAVANATPRRRHPVLKGAAAAGAVGLTMGVVSMLAMGDVFDRTQSGVSGQLAGHDSRRITSSRFP